MSDQGRHFDWLFDSVKQDVCDRPVIFVTLRQNHAGDTKLSTFTYHAFCPRFKSCEFSSCQIWKFEKSGNLYVDN